MVVRMTMDIVLDDGETLVKSGAANLQKGVETVGGKLHLTNQRLIFKPRKFNVQTGNVEVALPDVHSSMLAWTKLAGVLPVFPNALAVYTKNGNEFRFTVFG